MESKTKPTAGSTLKVKFYVIGHCVGGGGDCDGDGERRDDFRSKT